MNILLALHLECYDGFQGAGVGKSSGSRARARVQSISMISDLADAGFFFLRGLKKSATAASASSLAASSAAASFASFSSSFFLRRRDVAADTSSMRVEVWGWA